MRIVIDMQGAQSTGSRHRGIGRYTMALVQEIVRNRGDHEVILAVNGYFSDSIEPIRTAFDKLLPLENIQVWNTVTPTAKAETDNDWRRHAGELLREAFLAGLKPDVVLVSSLFEGLTDNAVTSIAQFTRDFPTAVILYDLIPLIHHEIYLENPVVKAYYSEKIEFLRQADLWLAISESSRQEGISHLGLSRDWSVNISTDADGHFRKVPVSAEAESELRKKYGLYHPFVMYTGGIDHRKNIEGLIRSYAKLPKKLRSSQQLAIVCSIQAENRRNLEALARKCGLEEDELILTGFVTEEDLVRLYNLCHLFVFPSWHEGFGLPALEAMRCGAPVIGANTSSLPEVIGLPEALFDPHSDDDFARLMERALNDEDFRARLVKHGKHQAMKFSWAESARRAIVQMERLVAHQKSQSTNSVPDRRLKLAYISPLPPERSGIADYSAELLPELARHYDIEVVVVQDNVTDEWINANCPIRTVQYFRDNASSYDRVLYQFGNSAFHQHMFELLGTHPGVVVLHDFYLSGISHYMEAHAIEPAFWTKELYHAHGYAAFHDRYHSKDEVDVIWKYPCSLSVVQNSLGVIAHSQNSLRLAKRWYGDNGDNWAVIPHMRDPHVNKDRALARQALGLGVDDFVVCSFGMLGPTKLNHRLLEAWLNSRLGADKNCHLVFVGENHPGTYGVELLEIIRNHRVEKNIRITGWADLDLFRNYLAAADMGVQLRTLSRGETSGTVLDCMCHSLATIVNANGSMADLNEQAVWMLSDEFSDEELITALETLWQDGDKRQSLGKRAREVILEDHDPRYCAGQYQDAIENFYKSAQNGLPGLLPAIAKKSATAQPDTELIALSSHLADCFPLRPQKKQLLLDVSGLIGNSEHTVIRNTIREWLINPPDNYRIEPVYALGENEYRYARHFSAGLMGCPEHCLQDEPIEFAVGDIFFVLDVPQSVQTMHSDFYQTLRVRGVMIQCLVDDASGIQRLQNFGGNATLFLEEILGGRVF